ncbi:MAG: hypothetical protein IJV06_02195 [Bacteroidaceae bacterium]|nr:hypothetical protein [Bacteroidaceae bacterium]
MKRLSTLLLALSATAAAVAQTDVTKYYLSNYGFDTDFNYTKESSVNVAEEVLDIPGWTADNSASYTIAGVYEMGFKGKYNGASVPATGYDGEAGGGLALSTGWDQTFKYYQTVTLPAGTYTLSVPTYNGSDKTAATSLVAWIPSSGTQVASRLASYPIGKWTLDKITFTLTKTTTGKIQIGMKAAANGSANSAKIFIDYVKLEGTDMAVDKTELEQTIRTALEYYGDGSGNEAESLLKAITAAQTTDRDETADIISVLEETRALNDAIAAYRAVNISEENPYDVTHYIQNPSFEKNGTEGWTVSDLQSQSNTSFTKKQGSIYLEKWVGSGSVGSASLSQVVKNLPNGKYRLTVAAQNYTQSSTSKRNTGAYIYAADQQTTVYTPGDYSVSFTSIAGEVEIGFVAENATGNWIAVDNFRLYQVGYVDDTALVEELSRLVATATALQTQMMSATAATALQQNIDAANAIIGGATAYNADTTLALQAAIAAAETSIAEYAALSRKIAAIQPSYDETKEGAADFLSEIEKAQALAQNPEATSAELAAAIDTLDTALLAFNLANATPGTGIAPAVTQTNHYVATGATEALVRATMTGSNILERGVCWSTEHNPTVLDNRSTKYFNLKGYIFHAQGLKPATVYYIRPYVMNKTYTVAYGDEIKIVTHPKGTCTWSWNEGAPTADANTRCRNAMKETIDYFNEWTGIKGFHLSGSYGAQTQTADCSYGGSMRIGPNASYQAIGTVLHETGHGVGVGTHWRWYSCEDTRADQGKYGKWLGREANEVLHFLENYYGDEVYFTGDAVHGWGTSANTSIPNATISYDWLVNGADKDKHQELQYIGGMCILHGLFIDGLCPTWNDPNGISGYTYNFDDQKKYYLMSKDTERGLGNGLLYQRNLSSVSWKPYLENETVSDSAAWYMEYNPQLGYYMFRNAMSGRYLTHSNTASTVGVKSAKSPTTTEYFQLMPDRTDVTLAGNDTQLTTHGYWFTWAYNGSNKAMGANALNERTQYGTIPQATFDYSDAATQQQWIIISEDELEIYQKILGVEKKPAVKGDFDGDGRVTVEDIAILIEVYLNGGSTAEAGQDTARYDLDESGSLSINDITVLIEMYLNNTTTKE